VTVEVGRGSGMGPPRGGADLPPARTVTCRRGHRNWSGVRSCS